MSLALRSEYAAFGLHKTNGNGLCVRVRSGADFDAKFTTPASSAEANAAKSGLDVRFAPETLGCGARF